MIFEFSCLSLLFILSIQKNIKANFAFIFIVFQDVLCVLKLSNSYISYNYYVIFCFLVEDQKMVAQTKPPCTIDANTDGMCALKQEHDLRLPICKTFVKQWSLSHYRFIPGTQTYGCCCLSLKNKVRAGFTCFRKHL